MVSQKVENTAERETMTLLSVSSPNAITEAVKILTSGGVVVYPTDTLYGLGADALNSEAVEKISKIKRRPGPWSIAVTDLNMLKEYCKIPIHHEEFINSQLPGAVTLILPGTSHQIENFVASGNTVGVRIPNHSVPVELAKALKKPITSTSVNRTGEPPLNDPKTIDKQFSTEIDLIIDAGTLPCSSGSTIYNLTTENVKTVR